MCVPPPWTTRTNWRKKFEWYQKNEFDFEKNFEEECRQICMCMAGIRLTVKRRFLEVARRRRIVCYVSSIKKHLYKNSISKMKRRLFREKRVCTKTRQQINHKIANAPMSGMFYLIGIF